MNWREVRRQTLGWLFPVAGCGAQRPVYSTISFLFHVGLLLVPLFLAAHVLLWSGPLGFAWPAFRTALANYLTL